MNNKVKRMVLAGLLTAIAVIIPVQFGFLKVIIPPFTATLGAHLPTFLAMLISPWVAIVVGLGSALGFFMAGTPIFVVARALMHIPVGFIGAKIIQKKKSFGQALIITAPIHAVLEALVVIPFGFKVFDILVVVAVGTLLHHAFDSVVSFALSKAVARANKTDMYSVFNQ